MTTDDAGDGWDELAVAARRETARIYKTSSSEYAKIRRTDTRALLAAAREQVIVDEEIRHYIDFGLSDAGVAIRLAHLGVRKHHVATVRAAA